MPVRVATLTRRSLDQAHQPFSIEAQDSKLKAYIQSQDDWQLVRTYSDDMSGATLDRPGLQASLRDARAGRFDVLLVYRVDRIARSLRGLLEILDELDQAGVAFRSVSEHFDTATPVGRMLIQILGAFAEFERATIIDRIVAGMERKAARGAWCGGYRPFGYQVDPTSHHLLPHPEEAPLVPAIFDLYANQRLGAKAVAGRLNDRGHRTRTGRRWNHLAVLQELAELLERVRAAVRQGPPPVRKSLVEALVEEIRVHGRGHIVPVFRLPNGRHRPDGAVRPGVSWVAPTGFEPALPP